MHQYFCVTAIVILIAINKILKIKLIIYQCTINNTYNTCTCIINVMILFLHFLLFFEYFQVHQWPPVNSHIYYQTYPATNNNNTISKNITE